MRLANGIVIDAEKTLGDLKFSALRRERMVEDEEGKSTGEVKERTYDLRSKGQGMMIQISVPADISEKKIPSGTPVTLVNPKFDTVVSPVGYNSVEVNWYIKADDIVSISAVANQPISKTADKNINTQKKDDAGAKN